MFLAQIQDGICIGIQQAESVKPNTIEIPAFDTDYLNRQYDGAWGEKAEMEVEA